MVLTRINVSREEIKTFERLNVISQIVPIRDKIRYFEQKYGCTLETFETRKKGEENFEQWDDYIEWKAYTEKLKDLELTLQEIEHAQDINVS
ncbi:MAG: hypothetical protein N2Z84_03665 [Atribacterota bacterium]|nr:hypothetical protein [Atribacterota bacterium]